MSATREDVVREALSWVGTRYHSCASQKGKGVDCGLLLREIYCGLGLAPWFDPLPYKPQWYMHNERPVYLEWLQKYAHRVEHPGLGDVAMFNFGKHAAHGGVIVSESAMVHAYLPRRRVIVSERRQFLQQFDSYWSCF